MASYTRNSTIIALLLVCCAVSSTVAQTNIQGNDGYFSTLMDSLSTMDWQGMLRTVVETAMQYFTAPTNRLDGAASSRAMHSFEADLIVNFVEQSPFLKHYAETTAHYVSNTAALVHNFI